MGVQSITLTLDDTTTIVPVEWEDTELEASFGAISGQPSIDIDRFTFVNEAARFISNYRKAGLTGGRGIFEGVPANLVLKDQDLNQVIFNGYLDLTEDYEEIEPQFKGDNLPVQVKCKFVSLEALNSFDTTISGISFSYLESQGVFTSADYTNLPFIIEAGFNPIEIATTALSIYTLEQAIEDAIARVASSIATVIAVATSSLISSIAGAILAIVLAALEVILALAMVALIIQLAFDMVNLLLSPVRFHKVTSLKTLITKALAFYEFEVQAELPNWEKIYYLPSRPASDGLDLSQGIFPEPPVVKKGIPRTGDFGYFITEMLDIVRQVYGARIDIVGKNVLIYNESNPIWKSLSDYTMKDTLLPGKKFNTRDLAQTQVYTARTDPKETWTIENYTGNAYEIKTEPKTVGNVKQVSIKGLFRVDLQVAWATRKDRLNNLEEFLKLFTDVAGDLLGVLKKGKKLRNIFTRRIGMMKVSDSAHSVPKLVLLDGGEIPANHRDILGMKAIAETRYKHKSFVDDTDNGQRSVYNGIEDIPFTLVDFKKTIKSSNFTTAWGADARFRRLAWKFAKDFCNSDFDVQEKYTNNLKEIKLEENG